MRPLADEESRLAPKVGRTPLNAKHGADAVLGSGTNISGSTTFSSGQWGSNTTTTGGVYGNYFNAQSRTKGGGFGSTTRLPIRKG